MRSETCDQSLCDDYLRGDLSRIEEEEFICHLDVCQACGEALEARAADTERWDEARTLLSHSISHRVTELPDASPEGSLPFAARQVLNTLGPTDQPDSLGRINGFEILGVVGCGAMGVVLKAEDRPLDRIVALKVMNPAIAASGTARQRFAREAKAAAAILHPNVIAIHGVSTGDGLPYLVMPYLRGVSLQQRIENGGPLDLAEILRVGSQIAAGLAAAHQQGVIHRDIKPSNIMLDEGTETAVITDFGLARTIDDATMTRSGAITGTPEFMSPEQARGESLEFKSDLFSLGSLLYMMCTGRPPFQAETAFGVLRRISDAQPRPIRELNPSIPRWFCRIVENLQAKNLDDRPSAAQVQGMLERCLAHVYQPDRIPLPKDLQDPQPVSRPLLTRYHYLGGAVLMLIPVLFVLLQVFPGFQDQGESSGKREMSPTIGLQEKDFEQVFKTLKVDFPQPEKVGVLDIDINRGFIEVVSHDEPYVSIDVLYPPVKENGKRDGELKRQFAPQFDLDTDKASNEIKFDTYNYNYVLNLRVKVPKRTDLVLDTYYDGYLSVKDVIGNIDARSQHSDIQLLDISGAAKIYGYNSNITVRFQKVDKDARLDFESYNGSIDLTLPPDISATTAISAGIGSYATAFELIPIEKSVASRDEFERLSENEYRFALLNGGGIPIRIECAKGEISLRELDSEEDE